MDNVTLAPSAPAAQATAPAAAPVAPVAPVQPAVPVLDPNAFPSQPGVSSAPAVPPVTQAPPQAPVQQPPAQQPPQQETLTLNQPQAYKHEPTGNAAFDIAMTAFAGAGFSPDHPAFIPASKGDFTLLEAFIKEKGVDPQYLALAKQAHQQISEHHEANHGKVIKETLELVGGAERWAKVQAWVQATADASEIESFKKQLEAGGTSTKTAAKYLSDLYAQHGENVVGQNPADPFNTNSSPHLATTGAPLDPAQFRQELGKLIEKVGYSGLEASVEYQQLKQRRHAWRG